MDLAARENELVTLNTDREKVIKGLECCSKGCSGSCTYSVEGGDCCTALAADALKLLKAQEPITGETSDGYHTFNELYHHRAVLFSVIVANYPDKAWKSKKHHDGTMYNGMFIVGIDTPDGQATYHYDIDPYWDMFNCRVLDNAPEWDGHTPAQAIERIGKLKAQEPVKPETQRDREWISVKERLPEERETIFAKLYGTDKWTPQMFRKASDDVRVVCVFEDGTRRVWHDSTQDGKWASERPGKYPVRRITHWMENPELPKGGEVGASTGGQR